MSKSSILIQTIALIGSICALLLVNIARMSSPARSSCSCHHHLSSLQRIVLTSNRIDMIPFPSRPEDSVLSIKYLSLSNNLLNAWSDIDALSCWFPKLETLTISGNPLVNGDGLCRFLHMRQFKILPEDIELGKHSRPFIIARIPSLLTLDGAVVSDIIQHMWNIEMERVPDISQRTFRFRTFLYVSCHAARANIG